VIGARQRRHTSALGRIVALYASNTIIQLLQSHNITNNNNNNSSSNETQHTLMYRSNLSIESGRLSVALASACNGRSAVGSSSA
jgi:hypothetical protein